jgi:hypothetical protein
MSNVCYNPIYDLNAVLSTGQLLSALYELRQVCVSGCFSGLNREKQAVSFKISRAVVDMRTIIKILYVLTITLVAVFIVLVVVENTGPLMANIKTGAASLKSVISLAVRGDSAAQGGDNPSAGPSPGSGVTKVSAGDLSGSTGMDGIVIYEYGKSLLKTQEQRSCYDQIAAAVLNVEDSIEIYSALDPVKIEEVYEYYLYDHAEDFYLNSVSVSYSYTQNGSTKNYNSFTFKITYLYDRNTVIAMRARMGAAAARMLSAAGGKAGDAQKERALHDALVGTLHYDNSAVGNEKSHPDSFTAYGAFVDNAAVCDGYAKAMKLLLDSAGIESIYVSGTATNSSGKSAHAWDMARISGKWFYLDPTFDDPVFYNSKGQYVKKSIIDHTYFNFISDASHKLGVFDTANPFSDSSENYEIMPAAG